MSVKKPRKQLYENILRELFFGPAFCNHARDPSRTEMRFTTDDIEAAKGKFTTERIGNVGDVTYAYRQRRPLPPDIAVTAAKGKVWVIEGVKRGTHAFRQVSDNQIAFTRGKKVIDILDATPEIVKQFPSFRDEQALLTIVRYNRLVDLFLGITAYPVQSHLRTTVRTPDGARQIEIDELYVGHDQDGRQYLIPVQAKRNDETITAGQVKADILFCRQRIESLPDLADMSYKSVGVQFTESDDFRKIAFMEFDLQEGEPVSVREIHYALMEVGDYRRRRSRTGG